MPRQPPNWPVGTLPRMLDVKLAAYYVGLSPTTFVARVEAGQYPKPQQDGKRQLWDRLALDALLDVRAGMRKHHGNDEVDLDEKARIMAALG